VNSSAIAALLGTLLGGGLTIASNLLLEHVRTASKAQQLSRAIAGEASALIMIVEARGYIAMIKGLADLARRGERRRLEIMARRDYFPTIEANLDSIGLLPADLPILVPRLLTFSKSALEDFDRLATAKEAAIAELNLARQYDKLAAVIEEAMSAARQIVTTVAAIYGSPHGRLPIGLKWRLRKAFRRQKPGQTLGDRPRGDIAERSRPSAE